MRRKDREITDLKEIIRIIDKCDIIRLGLSDEGIPYIVPLNFAYEAREEPIIFYFHSATEGRKIDILKKNPYVCFELDGSFQIIQNETPCKWSAEHESVVGYGNVGFINDDREKKTAMDLIMHRYGYEGIPEYSPAVFNRTLVYKLTVCQITGKSYIKKQTDSKHE
jgi:nitroimidazol reductase NimA-like FMN-containing flavoprotein (pyridoxamine 5'-phosphate oxidase superfamily)